ncbi:TLD-domain-containing protein [Pavlovales sp. CCMP2436]|nr:TLD-domain-containing protein [Pavlovales sp. CCMP2436]
MGASESQAAVAALEVPVAEPAPPLLTDTAGKGERSSQLLPKEAVAAVARRMPAGQRERWRLLFNSNENGRSFSSFQSHVLGQGPTVVVVRDTQGHSFGGYACESWTLGPKFNGGYSCFLFRLTPELQLFGTSGYSTNFMYINDGKKEVPNGVGFGGQVGYFGFFINDGLDTGEASGQCATFDGGVYDQHTRFDIDTVEVWATREPDVDPWARDEEGEGDGSSVLARKKVDKEFMSMASNRTFHSDNI